jgi:hypothetical protein
MFSLVLNGLLTWSYCALKKSVGGLESILDAIIDFIIQILKLFYEFE